MSWLAFHRARQSDQRTRKRRSVAQRRLAIGGLPDYIRRKSFSRTASGDLADQRSIERRAACDEASGRWLLVFLARRGSVWSASVSRFGIFWRVSAAWHGGCTAGYAIAAAGVLYGNCRISVGDIRTRHRGDE